MAIALRTGPQLGISAMMMDKNKLNEAISNSSLAIEQGFKDSRVSQEVLDIIQNQGFYPRMAGVGNVIVGSFVWAFTLDANAIAKAGDLVPDLRNANPGASAPIQANGGIVSAIAYPGKIFSASITDLKAMFFPFVIEYFSADVTSTADTDDIEEVRKILENVEIFHNYTYSNSTPANSQNLAKVSRTQFSTGKAIAAAVNPAATFTLREGSRENLHRDGLVWSGDPVYLSTSGSDTFKLRCETAVAARTAGSVDIRMSIFGAMIPNVDGPEKYRQGGPCDDSHVKGIMTLANLYKTGVLSPTDRTAAKYLKLLG